MILIIDLDLSKPPLLNFIHLIELLNIQMPFVLTCNPNSPFVLCSIILDMFHT